MLDDSFKLQGRFSIYVFNKITMLTFTRKEDVQTKAELGAFYHKEVVYKKVVQDWRKP